MAFDSCNVNQVGQGYDILSRYLKSVRFLFEIIDVRFRIPEYGHRLGCLAGNRLFSNASGYLLNDDSPYPFYLWLPSWLGRFYVDPDKLPPGQPLDDCLARDAGAIAFIWTWMGFNDAYVADSAPECWFGVARPLAADGALRVIDIADMIWKCFRVERNATGEEDGWLMGTFHRNAIGCEIEGDWSLRRVPLAGLTSFYAVESAVIRPLGERFQQCMAQKRAAPVSAAPAVYPPVAATMAT